MDYIYFWKAKKNILSSKGKSLEKIAQKHKNYEKVLDLI